MLKETVRSVEIRKHTKTLGERDLPTLANPGNADISGIRKGTHKQAKKCNENCVAGHAIISRPAIFYLKE